MAARTRSAPETREHLHHQFEPEGEDGTFPVTFRLVSWATPQQRDGRAFDGWLNTGPALRHVLIEGLTRRGLEALLADGISCLACNGTD